MFFHFILHEATAKTVSGGFLDPVAEFYQTWTMTDLDPLVPTDATSTSQWGRQGFSLGGAPDDGVSYKAGQTRLLLDPQVSYNLSDDLLEKGKGARYRLDIHWWKSEHGTEQVRATFTDAALKVLAKAWAANDGDAKAASAALEKWLGDNGDKLLRTGANVAGVGANPWVALGLDVLPLVRLLVDLAQKSPDDYLGSHSFVIEVEGLGDAKLRWRIIPPTGEPMAWVIGEGLSNTELTITDAKGRNDLRARYKFRMIE